jgi:hypothetical protein
MRAAESNLVFGKAAYPNATPFIIGLDRTVVISDAIELPVEFDTICWQSSYPGANAPI